ncbi:TPA: ATP-binding cassette domain-containing protein, partial [Legionella pneumophila]|nr:ATP-binding cassette domain-containing protein [Legionella pneumophila]
VVITGPSGIGKTTLLKIMLGLIVPTKGEVLIDGVSLEILGLKKYRSVCASVMQDDMLISGSILDNITFMDNKIDIDRVYQVARIAQIHEDILNIPMGYETLIGDMGSSLSGGQKQRILIARALYKNPKILFLDEASSHLDIDTEIKINNALKQLKITQVVIAHRTESIKMADRIIDLSQLMNSLLSISSKP